MEDIIINGVHFNREACNQMTREDFVKSMGGVFFQDKTPEDREKLLGDAYDAITGTNEEPEQAPKVKDKSKGK